MTDVLALRHVPHEPMGTIADALRRAGFSHRTLDVWKRPPFPPLDAFKALVIMGGPMGVYERKKYPFLSDEIRFIRAFIKSGRPVLGVCLGSQLIAAALGARVRPNERKEIGWYPVTLTAAGKKDPLLKESPSVSVVFQWHGDTFTRPPRTAHLARSPLCRHQAIRFRNNVYGLQFHLEVTPAMVREWLAQPGTDAELSTVERGVSAPALRRRIQKGLPRRLPALGRLARSFFDGWARLIPRR